MGEGQRVQVPPAWTHECLQHHQQGGPGQVVVGEQHVDDAEVEPGPDEQVRPALCAVSRGVGEVCRFECPDGRGPDRYHPVSGPAGIEGRFGDRVGLGVHHVVVKVAGGDGPEGVEAHHKLKVFDRGARCPAGIQHLTGQVEARRGCCCRGGTVAVDGLVALRVVEAGVQVRGQGHLAVGLHGGEDARLTRRWVGVQHDRAPALAKVVTDRDGQVVAGPKPRSRRNPPAGPHEGLPLTVIAGLFQQQDLDCTAGLLGQPQPGRQHPGVVEDQQVTGADHVGQVADMAMVRTGPVGEVDKQAGRGPVIQGNLGDLVVRQVVGEVVGAHGRASLGGARRPREVS